MRLLERELRLALMALQFLTRLPVPAWVGYEPALFRRAVRHFPLVGGLIGMASAAVAVVGQWVWSDAVAATLAVAFTVWLTVALHEDGLADSCDALMGATSREKALAIMKDSRIGSYGAAALGLVLLLRVALLAQLLACGALAAAAALVASHAAGRTLAVVLMHALPYAGDDAQAKTRSLTRTVQAFDVAWAVVAGALVLGLAAAMQAAPLTAGAAAVAVVVALFLGLRAWLRRRLQGHTGDTLGAAEQLGEVAVLLAMAAAVPR